MMPGGLVENVVIVKLHIGKASRVVHSVFSSHAYNIYERVTFAASYGWETAKTL